VSSAVAATAQASATDASKRGVAAGETVQARGGHGSAGFGEGHRDGEQAGGGGIASGAVTGGSSLTVAATALLAAATLWSSLARRTAADDAPPPFGNTATGSEVGEPAGRPGFGPLPGVLA
jgi:hypothetical protein